MGVDFTKAALAAGHAVVATGRDTSAVAKAVGEADNLLVVKLDVTSRVDAEAAARAAQEAVRGMRTHHLTYYDAQVLAAARLNQVGVIFSEDFAEGTTLESVRFISPFSDGFVLEAWT